MIMGIQKISTDKAPAAIGPYSQAIKAGDFLFVSGQIPIDPETGDFVPGGIKEQAHQVFKNLKAILSSQGLDFSNAVKTTVLLNSIDDFAAVNEVYAQYFSSEPLPARAAFAVDKLPKGALVEIELIAWSITFPNGWGDNVKP